MNQIVTFRHTHSKEEGNRIIHIGRTPGEGFINGTFRLYWDDRLFLYQGKNTLGLDLPDNLDISMVPAEGDEYSIGSIEYPFDKVHLDEEVCREYGLTVNWDVLDDKTINVTVECLNDDIKDLAIEYEYFMDIIVPETLGLDFKYCVVMDEEYNIKVKPWNPRYATASNIKILYGLGGTTIEKVREFLKKNNIGLTSGI